MDIAHKLLETLEKRGLFECNTYSQNQIVKHFHQTSNKKVYLVKCGIVKISCPNEFGEKITPIILTKNQFFGFTQLFCDSCMNYSYEAIMDKTVLHEFHISQIHLMIDKNIIAMNDVFFSVGQEYNLLEKRIMILQNRFIKKRLCKTILEFTENLTIVPLSKKNTTKDIPISQDELASYIRASRIIINKIFNKLKRNFFRDCLNH